jgi:hypothetical protein
MRAAVALLVLAVTPAVARAQGAGMAPTPLAVDLKKAKLGDWSEYSMTAGPRTGKLRWALISRDGENHTLEMTMEAGPATGGQKMAMQMTLVPNPTTSSKPVKKLVMQMGAMDPMEMPLDMPGMSGQRFEKPDPKKKVGQGKEQLKVAAGTFSADHYRDTVPQGTVDVWINDTVVPLGLVKMTLTPKEGGGAGPGGPMALELTSKGKGAKPTITKPAKPFDPAAFGMPGGHGAPPPGSGTAPPPPAPPKK